jgi:lysophospholipid hydrolase
MRQMCPTGTVIGVELLTGTPVSHKYDFGPSFSGWRALLSHLVPFARPIQAPTLLHIVAGLIDSTSRSRLNEIRHLADLIIQVPVEPFGLLEFDRYPEIIERGYTAAKEQIERAWPEAGGPDPR